jgi:hypothetical protein
MLGDLLKIAVGIKQNSEAKKINPVYTPYEVSPYAKAKLGLASSLYGGRGFGFGREDRNIATNQANTVSNAGRNATDASQLLAVGAAAQGSANQAYSNEQEKENKQQLSLLDNLNEAYNGMTNEDRMVYQDKLNKYGIDSRDKAALRSSGWNNIFGGIDGMEQQAMQAAQMMMGMPPTAGKSGGGISSGLMGDMNSLAGSNWGYSR